MVRWSSLSTAAVVVVAVVLALPSTVRADVSNPHLAKAREYKAALQYDAARDSLSRAVAWGRNSPRQMAQIYRLGGELEASLGNGAAAISQFQMWLAIDPKAGLPPGTSPKLTEPFANAEAYFKARNPLLVEQRLQPSPPAAVIRIGSDPMAMAAGARVEYRVAGGRWRATEARGSGVLRVALPTASRVEAVVTVIDRRGNALVMFGSRTQPLTVSTLGVSSRPLAQPTQRAFLARWQLWAGFAVALAAGTGYFALDTRDAQQEIDDLYARSADIEFSEIAAKVDELERRGKRSSRLTNVGIAVTSAAVLAAIVFAATGHSASVAPTPGGAQVSLGFYF